MLPTLLLAALLFQTAPPQDQTQTPVPESQPPTQSESGLLTFHVTTREVIVDVIALDGHNRPIADLQPAELQVFDQSPDETSHHKHRRAEPETPPNPISSFNLIDPATTPATADPTGFRLSASCLERATLPTRIPPPRQLPRAPPPPLSARVPSRPAGTHLRLSRRPHPLHPPRRP